MTLKKRSIIGSLIGVALSVQLQSEALADSNKHIVIASTNKQPITNLYYEPTRIDWGWWVKSDWQNYLGKRLSKNNLKMLELASAHGDAQAQYVLGMFYSNEDKIENATYWLGKAAEQGHAGAEFTYNYYSNIDDDHGIGC